MNTQPFTKLGKNDWAALWILFCTVHSIICYIMPLTHFRVNLHSIVVWMSRSSLLKAGVIFHVLTDRQKLTLNHLHKLAKNDWAVIWLLICIVHLSVCYYHARYALQSGSTLCSCLNVKKPHARNQHAVKDR